MKDRRGRADQLRRVAAVEGPQARRSEETEANGQLQVVVKKGKEANHLRSHAWPRTSSV